VPEKSAQGFLCFGGEWFGDSRWLLRQGSGVAGGKKVRNHSVEAIMERQSKKRGFVEMELKYCERCGGLWLRQNGEHSVYCGPCIPKVAEEALERHAAGMSRLVRDHMERQSIESVVMPMEVEATLAEFERELEHLLVLGVAGGNA
jgi:hypothetical protein